MPRTSGIRSPVTRSTNYANQAKSLMPEGFEKELPGDDLANLLEFLTQKGKYVPIPLDRYATAIVSTKGMFIDENSTAERLIFKSWKPVEFDKVPFFLSDPQGDARKNVIYVKRAGRKIPAGDAEVGHAAV